MVYQLAKTSPLISGQVKCVCQMAGNTVENIQFVPISDSIPFAYKNPADTLNYTYMENIKMLHDKISDKFWSAEGKKSLSTDTLFYSKELYHDTHDGTYERGMKRLPFARYGKQFEFFCPIWCDNIDEFKKLKFKVTIEHPLKRRKIFSSFIDTTKLTDYFVKHLEEIGLVQTDSVATKEIENVRYRIATANDNPNNSGDYIGYIRIDGKKTDFVNGNIVYIMPDNTVWKFTSAKGGNTYAITEYMARDINTRANENTEMVYFDFTNQRAWVKGINAETGLLQICDDSYTLQNITSRERPLLEFDNMIANMFSRNKLVCTQLFNLDFIFNIEDFLPLEFLNDMIGDKINIYIDVYKDNKIVEFKDLYSNYDYIPRYDTFTSENSDVNALDYMHDNKAIELIDKNKLVQSTFHWAFQNNNDLEFNLYNGLSPVFDGQTRRVGFMGDFPNIYAKEFVAYDNPLCIMKYTKKIVGNSNKLMTTIIDTFDDDSSFYSYDTTNTDEYQWFGNMRINNNDFKNNVNKYVPGTLPEKVMYGILDLGETYKNIYDIICTTLSTNGFDVYNGNNGSSSYKNILIVSKNNKFMFIIFGYNSKIVQQIFYNNIIYKTYDVNNKKSENLRFINYLSTFGYGNNFYNGKIKKSVIKADASTLFAIYIEILKHVDQPALIKTNGTVISVGAKHPDNYVVEEVSLIKNDTNINMFRYDMNIYPMFIDTNINGKNSYSNNLYWQKQYIGNILNNTSKKDNILDFNTKSFTKFKPQYPSIDYFALSNTTLDYNTFYLNNGDVQISYNGEREWYNKNSLFILPTNAKYEYVSDKITESNIKALLYNNIFSNIEIEETTTDENIKRKIFDEFIFPLYVCSYTYDYINNTDISKYKYTITYTLK